VSSVTIATFRANYPVPGQPDAEEPCTITMTWEKHCLVLSNAPGYTVSVDTKSRNFSECLTFGTHDAALAETVRTYKRYRKETEARHRRYMARVRQTSAVATLASVSNGGIE
jgi:hypothetical protein